MIRIPFHAQPFELSPGCKALAIHVELSGIRTGFIIPDACVENDITVYKAGNYIFIDAYDDFEAISGTWIFNLRLSTLSWLKHCQNKAAEPDTALSRCMGLNTAMIQGGVE